MTARSEPTANGPFTRRRAQPNAFGSYATTPSGVRRWSTALTTSSALYAAAAAVVVMLGSATRDLVTAPAEPVDVTFVERIPRPEPPPLAEVDKPSLPSLPEAKPAPRRLAAAAAVVPKNMKVRELKEPPPAKELVAPQEVPQAPPKEADPAEDKGVAVASTAGTVDPAGLEGSAGRDTGSITGEDLPAGAVPPKPLPNNPQPVYPRSARMTRRDGSVVLRCTVRADGKVTDLSVVRGEEPFASSALRVVRRWRYEPALLNGQPISVHHIIQVHFKLDA